MSPRHAAFAALTLAIAFTGSRAIQSQSPRVIHITAERFAFTPSQIVVEADEEVELRLKSDDTAHGFRIAGTAVNVTIPKRGRQELSVLFRPAAPGKYTFECTRMCGAGHDFMRGVVIVRPRTGR
jgi:cytochrome c oxidase subunit II